MIYVFVFLSSSLMLVKFNMSKIFNNIFVGSHSIKFDSVPFLLAAVPVLYIGANRSILLGTDNAMYFVWFQNMVYKADFIDGMTNGGTKDILYNLLVYLVAIFTNDYSSLCFWTTLFTIYPILWGIKLSDDYLSDKAFSLIVFFLMFYCGLLNIVRQGIALSICFLSLVYFIKKRFITFVICVVIATLFHRSAIVFFILPFLYKCVCKGNFFQRLSLFVVTSISVMFFLNAVIPPLIEIGLLTSKYEFYIDKISYIFSFKQTMIKFPLLLLCTLSVYKNFNNMSIKLLYTMIWVDLILSQFEASFGPLVRIAYYFQYAYILLIPITYNIITKRWNKILFLVLVLIYLSFYWLYFTCLNGYGFNYPVFPYMFNE